jgi:hypothetical protein
MYFRSLTLENWKSSCPATMHLEDDKGRCIKTLLKISPCLHVIPWLLYVVIAMQSLKAIVDNVQQCLLQRSVMTGIATVVRGIPGIHLRCSGT